MELDEMCGKATRSSDDLVRLAEVVEQGGMIDRRRVVIDRCYHRRSLPYVSALTYFGFGTRSVDGPGMRLSCSALRLINFR